MRRNWFDPDPGHFFFQGNISFGLARRASNRRAGYEGQKRTWWRDIFVGTKQFLGGDPRVYLAIRSILGRALGYDFIAFYLSYRQE